MSSYTDTYSRTDARYLASKVVSDLYQCSRVYGSPPADDVPDYEDELIEMLLGRYVSRYEFGFKKDGKRIVCWRYEVNSAGELVGGSDDRSGGVYARAKVVGATYYNHMSYSDMWFDLSEAARLQIRARLQISRSPKSLPSDGNGYWVSDRNYSSGGVSVSRKTFRPS